MLLLASIAQPFLKILHLSWGCKLQLLSIIKNYFFQTSTQCYYMVKKFTKNHYSSAMFDITQDINGGLPIKLIEQWLESEQTYEDALQVLQPYKVNGYSICSDSAGLTKLSQQKGLLEILAIINQPKEIVHSFGTAIGGQAIGIWAADNTQMFYPASISPITLLSAMLKVQDEIKKSCQIKIGLAAHYGEFFYINGGLYGLEAETIEEIAENHTEGGEFVISQSIYNLLPTTHDFTFLKKTEQPTPIGDIFRVRDGSRLSDTQPLDKKYPIPYSEAFYTDLVAYTNRQDDGDFGKTLENKYIQQKVVVLVEARSTASEAYDFLMLNSLSIALMMRDIGTQLLLKNNGVEIKIVGALGIYVFDEAAIAINFAQAFRQELAKQDISCRIGIDAGSVLIFPLENGGKDIAGMPVNVASKMAQDKGEFGKLYLSESMKQFVDVREFTEVKYTVSGVEITTYEC